MRRYGSDSRTRVFPTVGLAGAGAAATLIAGLAASAVSAAQPVSATQPGASSAADTTAVQIQDQAADATRRPITRALRASEPVRSVRTARGVERFVLDGTTADASLPAARVVPDGAARRPALAAREGYRLTGRLVLRDTEDARRALRARGLTPEPIEGLHGYLLAHAGSTLRAIALSDELAPHGAFVDVQRPIALRELPGDPNLADQWHLRNTSNTLADVNVEPAWAMGYTGAGVIVGIVEGGYQVAHPDLFDAYNNDASTTSSGNGAHATSVAGVVGARAFNSQGGVGVAYNCQLANLRYGTDSQTAAALGHRNDLNDIKNNSWGPFDNGDLHTISAVEKDAIVDGVHNGRGGLGTVFVWAAGNGGINDRVDYDPYASSRYTIAIGAVGDQDQRAWYNETGSSILAVTHSDGNSRAIFTTTAPSTYTPGFGGTSSASPLASGVVALMLEANPALTWRDVQHVLVDTARVNHPGQPDWVLNGAGRMVNENYGFGAIDAEQAVLAALNWTNVEPESTVSSATLTPALPVPDNDPAGLVVPIEVAGDLTIESFELVVSLTSTYIGDLEISVISPQGTLSRFTEQRFDGQESITDYVFTSLRSWGESAQGTWTLQIKDLYSDEFSTLDSVTLHAHGVAAVPACPGDLTTTGGGAAGVPDGETNLSDLQYYLGIWQAKAPEADTNTTGFWNGIPDGEVNLSDLQLFLTDWSSGLAVCP